MAKGKFKSERQRRFLFAVYPSAAHKWAHGVDTTKADWKGGRGKKVVTKRGRRAKR